MYEEALEEEELDASQHFQVNIVILEAKHLAMINSDAKVVVTIGNRRKTLRSKTAKTDAPYFNELCIFNFYISLSVLLDEILQIRLYGVPKIRKNKLIGSFSVELATIWDQPNHQFYHKWAALTDPKNPAAGVKGYLKCDIGILSQGTTLKPTDQDPAETIEDHLMVPYGEVNDRQRARFVFTLFRADSFSDYVASQPLRSLYAYVRITYAGVTGKTSVANRTFSPSWNEELAFVEMIPALCQYVHIEICDAYKTTAKGVLGTANLDLRKLSHESEKGFLPTYGPSFLYLYQNFGKFERHNKCGFVSSSFTYMCRLLMALRTEVVDYAEDVLVKKTNMSVVKPKKIPSLEEDRYFQYSEFIFFAAVFDVLLFDANVINNKVSVRVIIGPEKPVTAEEELKAELKPALKKTGDGNEDGDDKSSIKSKKTVTFEDYDLHRGDSGFLELPTMTDDEEATQPPPGSSDGDTRKKHGIRQWKPLRRLGHWTTTWRGSVADDDPPWEAVRNWRFNPSRKIRYWPTTWERKRKKADTTSEDSDVEEKPRKKLRLPQQWSLSSKLQKMRKTKEEKAKPLAETSSSDSIVSYVSSIHLPGHGTSDEQSRGSGSTDSLISEKKRKRKHKFFRRPPSPTNWKPMNRIQQWLDSGLKSGRRKMIASHSANESTSESGVPDHAVPGADAKKDRESTDVEEMGKPKTSLVRKCPPRQRELNPFKRLDMWPIQYPKRKSVVRETRPKRKILKNLRRKRAAGQERTSAVASGAKGQSWKRIEMLAFAWRENRRKFDNEETPDTDSSSQLGKPTEEIRPEMEGRPRTRKRDRIRQKFDSLRRVASSPRDWKTVQYLKHWRTEWRKRKKEGLLAEDSSTGDNLPRRSRWRDKFHRKKDSSTDESEGKQSKRKKLKRKISELKERARNRMSKTSESGSSSRTESLKRKLSSLKGAATSVRDWPLLRSLRQWPTEWPHRKDKVPRMERAKAGPSRFKRLLENWKEKHGKKSEDSTEESAPVADDIDELLAIKEIAAERTDSENSLTSVYSCEECDKDGEDKGSDKTIWPGDSELGEQSSYNSLPDRAEKEKARYDLEEKESNILDDDNVKKKEKEINIQGENGVEEEEESSSLDESDTSSESGDEEKSKKDEEDPKTSPEEMSPSEEGPEQDEKDSNSDEDLSSEGSSDDDDDEFIDESEGNKDNKEKEKNNEDEFKKALQSAKDKKRYWYDEGKKKKNVFSPQNTTEVNLQVYFAIKEARTTKFWQRRPKNIFKRERNNEEESENKKKRKKWNFWRRKRKRRDDSDSDMKDEEDNEINDVMELDEDDKKIEGTEEDTETDEGSAEEDKEKHEEVDEVKEKYEETAEDDTEKYEKAAEDDGEKYDETAEGDTEKYEETAEDDTEKYEETTEDDTEKYEKAAEDEGEKYEETAEDDTEKYEETQKESAEEFEETSEDDAEKNKETTKDSTEELEETAKESAEETEETTEDTEDSERTDEITDEEDISEDKEEDEKKNKMVAVETFDEKDDKETEKAAEEDEEEKEKEAIKVPEEKDRKPEEKESKIVEGNINETKKDDEKQSEEVAKKRQAQAEATKDEEIVKDHDKEVKKEAAEKREEDEEDESEEEDEEEEDEEEEDKEEGEGESRKIEKGDDDGKHDKGAGIGGGGDKKTEEKSKKGGKGIFWSWKPKAMAEDEESEAHRVTAKEVKHVRVYTGCNTTAPEPIKIRGSYGYVTFSGQYPCVHVNGQWPNALRRMYRSNIIQRSVRSFAAGISDVENELVNGNKIEASEKLKKALTDLAGECREILELTAKIEPEDTNLYRERKRYYHRELRSMIESAESTAKKKVLIAQDELKRAQTYLTSLKRYAQDPEDSFPDTEIWLIKDGKTVAQHRMRTQKIAFSANARERGVLSGKVQSVIVRGKDGEVVAKLEMFMWFGLGSEFVECREMLPSGFKHDPHRCPGTAISNVPLQLTYTETHHFRCCVYLFQARILTAADVSGLADPFVRVIIYDSQKESQVLKETLNPTWDEMLVFPKLTLYGPAAFIKDNSITITVEVIDYDYLSKNELIGRTLFKPVVKLKGDDQDEPPRLSWEDIRKDCTEAGKILLTAELREVSEAEPEEVSEGTLPIPKHIRPHSTPHRLEVLFWGVRELKKKAAGSVRAFVTLECGGKSLTSPVLKNASKNLNFPGTVQTLDLELPEEHDYKPPLILKLFQTNAFALGQDSYAGNCIMPSIKVFFCEGYDDEERKRKEIEFKQLLDESKRAKREEEEAALAEEQAKRKKQKMKRFKRKVSEALESVAAVFVRCYKRVKCKLRRSCADVEVEHLDEVDEKETLDWWVKYYASKEGRRDVETLTVYEEELEAQPEFHEFSDYIYTFNMVTGKVKKNIESQVLVGKVKAAIKLYKWPLQDASVHTLYGVDINKGVLKQLPSNAAIKYVARVYVISCKNLTPKDLYGKSDPYLILQVGEQRINDQSNYIPKQVNPIFGRCYEFRGIFPNEHLLRVKVMDHDVLTDDDLIGETVVDLESRYYTKHHASCGIPSTYSRSGYTAWRDAFRPTEILKTVCKQSNMEEPVYTEKGVRIGEYEFQAVTTDERHRFEMHALAALRKWQEIPLRGFQLVPEHVETRALYHPAFPGIEQGKIEMWIDIFPADFRYIPPIVDVQPRKPEAMELRVIVWNVEGVILDDTTLFFNEKMSDIYVQGWMNALEQDKQATDVHYRSMNGEGNFNWRFVFPFNYIATERRMVVYKKQHPFDPEPEEVKFPCRLELQVWDNDFFSDDFLGSLNLELCAMPRGAKISTRCKLSMFEDATPKINLFKIRRTRGWWPFRRIKDAESIEYTVTGKIDLELEVVTGQEAEENPVGKGRDGPKALPEPKRPESSFIWFLNPLKTCRYIICKKYGKYLLIALLVAMLIAFVLLGIYAFPGYAVKRMLGA